MAFVDTFMLFLCFTGEQEFTARNAGLSTVIVLSTIVPLMLLIIVISYRHIKRKNAEIEAMEQEALLAELEKQRLTIYQQMYDEHHQKEMEFFEEREEKLNDSIDVQSNVIDAKAKVLHIDQRDDSTDDEFFEMPLPPVPLPSPMSGKLSIIENEDIPLSATPSTLKINETPKVSNNDSSFKYPEQPTRPAPSPPVKKSFSPPLPTVPPRPKSLSPPNSPKIDGDANQPLVVDLTPKSLLQSDY